MVSRSEELYSRAFPKAKFNDNKLLWKFPSGAKIFFGYMEHEKDKLNYQGKAYDFVGFDEVTANICILCQEIDRLDLEPDAT